MQPFNIDIFSGKYKIVIHCIFDKDFEENYERMKRAKSGRASSEKRYII